MKNRNIAFTRILPVLVCFALLPKAQAVVPAPDGGYSGWNTAEGTNALFSVTSGVWNTALGGQALFHDTTGNANTGVGTNALFSNTTGGRNTANGVKALLCNIAGISNTAIGINALYFNTDNWNTAVGDSALFSNTTGGDNTAIGYQALRQNTTGAANTAMGDDALSHNTSGFGNTALGFQAGVNVTTANNVICIATSGANVTDSCFIGHIYSNVQPVVGTNPDYITIASNGRLGRANVSSRRYKHDIKPIGKASEAIYELNPVSFRYNKEYDATQTIAFGLVAEEVVGVNPDLVGRNDKGQPESVRYDQVNAMLLNEFLKEHRKVSALEQGMTVLTAQLKEQAAQIQKVSAQIELNRPAPRQVVLKVP